MVEVITVPKMELLTELKRLTTEKERNNGIVKVHGAANGGEGGKNASKNTNGKGTYVNEGEGEREGNGGDVTEEKNGVGRFPILTINTPPHVVSQMVVLLTMWYKKRKPNIIGFDEKRVIIYSHSANEIKMKMLMDGVEEKHVVFVEVTPRHHFVAKAYNQERKVEHRYVEDGNFYNASYSWNIRYGWLYVTVTDFKTKGEKRVVNKQG